MGPMSCNASSSSDVACMSALISEKALARVSAAVLPTWRMPRPKSSLEKGRVLLASIPLSRLAMERSPVRSSVVRSSAVNW